MRTKIKNFRIIFNTTFTQSYEVDNSVVMKYRRRMLEWPNPVEYVNNMYGCHPDDKRNTDYFKKIYGK